LYVWGEGAQPGDVFEVGLGESFAPSLYGFSGRGGGGVYLVVDVRDVASELDVFVEHLEQTKEDIEHHRGTAIADVNVVVNGRAAHVEAHLLGHHRGEYFFAATSTVVNVELHELVLRMGAGLAFPAALM